MIINISPAQYHLLMFGSAHRGDPAVETVRAELAHTNSRPVIAAGGAGQGGGAAATGREARNGQAAVDAAETAQRYAQVARDRQG